MCVLKTCMDSWNEEVTRETPAKWDEWDSCPSWCAHMPWAATPGTQPHPPTGWHQQFKGNKCCSFLPSPKHLRPAHPNEDKYVPFYTHVHTQSGTSTRLWNKACHIKTLLYTTRTTWSYEHNLNLCICLQTRALWTSPWSLSARGEQR